MSVTPEKITRVFVKYGEGDKEAFSFFYKYFINDLYAYGRSLGADEKHVMDAVQDVFLKVFHDKPRIQSVEHFKLPSCGVPCPAGVEKIGARDKSRRDFTWLPLLVYGRDVKVTYCLFLLPAD